jgi:hypothetical protein
MKFCGIVLFCLVCSWSFIRAEEEWTGESVLDHCEDIAGTYSTIFELTAGNIGQYGVRQDWGDGQPTYSDSFDIPDTDLVGLGPVEQQDLVGRVIFYQSGTECRVLLHFNVETLESRRRRASLSTNSTKKWIQRLAERYEPDYFDYPFQIDYDVYPAAADFTAQYYFLCGRVIARQQTTFSAYEQDTDGVFNAPNFEISGPPGSLGGSYCTVHDDDEINCSFQIQTRSGYTGRILNFRSTLLRRNDDIDDDIFTMLGGPPLTYTCTGGVP